MPKALLVILFFAFAGNAGAQQLDTIYFNLYTDSLKKGTFNYINVEGKFRDGRYLPLGSDDVKLSASYGHFEGNSLYIDSSIKDEKVTIKAVALANSNLRDEVVIYIKKYEADERLPTAEEVIRRRPSKR